MHPRTCVSCPDTLTLNLGSGWGWLVAKKGTQELEIVTTPNQNPIGMNQLDLLDHQSTKCFLFSW